MVSFQFFLWAIEDSVKQYPFTIGVYFLFSHMMLVIHEGGHAVAGALLGVPSTGIRIGTRPIFKVVVLGYSITVGWLPTSGHTTFVDEGNFPDTWQVLVTYLAGPLSVVCAGPLFFLLVQHSHVYTASIFGALFVLSGICDLRKNCPDGLALRRLWKVLRPERLKEAGQID
jgi:hypothetical protein